MTALRRIALPLALVALLAGTALGAGSSASQTRGKTNRTAILKNKAAKGETGRVKTRFVKDTGKSSLVKVMQVGADGKATGKVEAFLVNKQTGVARKTSTKSLAKKTRPTKSPKKKGTVVASSTEVAAEAEVESDAAETDAADTDGDAPATTTSPKAPRAPVKATTTSKPSMTAARSAVMEDPLVKSSASVAALDSAGVTPAEVMSVAIVEQRLKVTRKADYDVVPTFAQSRGDKTNPVTGSGVIELVATPRVKPSGWRRILHAFSPNAQRRVEVVLGADGQPISISDRADSLPFRIVRSVTERLPLGELASDVLRSDGVRKGGLIGALGGSVALMSGPIGLGVAVAVAPVALKMSIEGVKRRQIARQTALEEAVVEIKKAISDGNKVTIDEAYTSYEAKLKDIKKDAVANAPSSPATPMSKGDFVKALSAPPHNL